LVEAMGLEPTNLLTASSKTVEQSLGAS